MDNPNTQAIYTTPRAKHDGPDICSNIDRGKHKESNWRATSSDVIPSRLFINSPHNVTCGRRLHQANMKPPRAQARARDNERFIVCWHHKQLRQGISGAGNLHVTVLGQRAILLSEVQPHQERLCR